MSIDAEVDTDHQHGPIVRVEVNGITVAVYLADETAIVITEEGAHFGLEVHGSWPDFKKQLAALSAIQQREGKG